MELEHMPGKANPADLFTKILGRTDFEKHRSLELNLAARAAIYKDEPHVEA